MFSSSISAIMFGKGFLG